ncbi:ABC transporter substrate-binding protein [Kitasatospora sp. NPDC093679]|uniref:ABC transporter substrate-binding protein n=1 Tax=Kitasatospora sp. NPDC093679 TaxID=3154983 RepID=UPI0034265780
MAGRIGRRSTAGTRAGRAGRLAAAAALLPALLDLTGCAGGAGAAENAAVTVLTMAPSGSGSADRSGSTALAEAIGRSVSAKGGFGGHRLHVLTCNEQDTAEGAAACARQAVDAHAVAVIGSYSRHAEDFMPALEAAGIPYLGGYGLSGPEFSSPLSYPVAGGTPALIAGSGRQLVAAGCKSIALVRPDNRTGDTLTRYLSGALRPAGVPLTDVKAAEKGPDFTALARAAVGGDRKDGCVTTALGVEQTRALLDAYRKLAPARTRLGAVLGGVQQSVVDATGGKAGPLEGALVTGWYPPESSAVWDELRHTLEGRPADSPVDVSDLGVQTTWVAYQVFFQAADRLASAGLPLTAKTLRNQLDSGDSLDTGGVTPPLDWGMASMLPSAESPRLTNTWVTFQQVENGRLAQQQSGFVDVRWVLTGKRAPQ